MLFTIRRPKSQRFFQLSFEGFDAGGKNRLNRIIKKAGLFLKALNKYFVKRAKKMVILFVSGALYAVETAKTIKSFLVKKLIWSRGRLGRPLATFVVMVIAFAVFMFGEVLSSTKFVNSQEIDPDYLSNVTDIIPQRNVALTTIPESRKSTEAFVYRVEAGDTLSAIGAKLRISSDAIRYVNNLTDTDYLKVGQELVIPPISGLIHKVESGDTLASIAKKYDVPSQSIADFNYILDTSTLALGTELVIPGAKVPQPVFVPSIVPSVPSFVANVPPPQASSNYCVWPTSTRIITQYFSWYHNGLDVASPWGSAMPPLYACTGGRVVRSGWDPWGLGLHVRIDHGNGFETVYGHMSSVSVSFGQQVSRGQVIGFMGNTGRSTGPHVHFMVNYNGIAQNPLNYTN